MTNLETALAIALVGFVAYRVGWTAGASRMAAAFNQRPTGLRAWLHGRKLKKAFSDFRLNMPPTEEATEPEASEPGFRIGEAPRGQYL